MSKLTITISDEAHPILKEWAKQDNRTLGSYITVLLSKLTGVYEGEVYLPVEIQHTTKTYTHTVPVTNIIPITSPENPTGQTYTPTNQI